MSKKLRVGILFGGRSGEHEVSLLSAASVLNAIDRTQVRCGAHRHHQGRPLAGGGRRAEACWKAIPARWRAASAPAIPRRRPAPGCCKRAFRRCWRRSRVPQGSARRRPDATSFFRCSTAHSARTAPSRACSSWPASPTSVPACWARAAGMDKDVMKRLFAQAGLPIVKHVTLLRAEWEKSPKQSRRRRSRRPSSTPSS